MSRVDALHSSTGAGWSTISGCHNVMAERKIDNRRFLEMACHHHTSLYTPIRYLQ